MVDWNRIRSYFPGTRNYVYLNAASGSPISIQAARAAKQFYDEMLEHGDVVWPVWLERKEQVRQAVAKFINARPDEIAFTTNTSHGMNIVAEMLHGRGGVITMQDEFPTTTFPWLNRQFDMSFVEPEHAIYSMRNIESSLTDTTGILVTSHVQYCTGFRQDLEKLGRLCKRHKIIFVVNATQSIGAMPMDVRKANIDFLVFASLKWPMAGYGIGVVYINRRWHGTLHYPIAGWLSVKSPEAMDNIDLDLRNDASVLEPGCPHFPNIFALGGSIALLEKIGKKNIQARIFELSEYLAERLQDKGFRIVTPLAPEHRSGITIVEMEEAGKIVEALARHRIIVSARGEGIRISTHIYNNKKDIDTFIKALLSL